MKIHLHTNYNNFVLLFKFIYLIFGCINLVIYYNYLLGSRKSNVLITLEFRFISMYRKCLTINHLLIIIFLYCCFNLT